ncbi:MAG TPA: adenylate/guanylate cyclase domain-containing protein [Gammaproteobacteria bacterium]
MALSATRGCLVPVPADAFWAVDREERRISRWSLNGEPVTIGRSHECDVVIRDPSVSRRHAMLSWSGNKLLLTHLSTTNPTFVNGVPVPRDTPTELVSTDKLQIGGARFEVLLWNADSDAETRPHAPPRALAVVLAADVAGYTAMWQRDETGTLLRFHECLRVFRREAQRYRGRVLDTGEKGDCVYSLYHSVLLGLSAAIAIRRQVAELNRSFPADGAIRFRFGMHCGDVVIEGEGIRGDAINTAAHLQALTEPGEIIVSHRIQQEAETHLGFRFEPVPHPERAQEIVGFRLVGDGPHR